MTIANGEAKMVSPAMTKQQGKVLIQHDCSDAVERWSDMLDEQSVQTEPVDLVDLGLQRDVGDTIGAIVFQIRNEHADRTKMIPELAKLAKQGTPVIALVPPGRTGWMREAFLSGAYDCLMEPIDDAKLIHIVLSALRFHADSEGTTNRADGHDIDRLTGLHTHRSLLDHLSAGRSSCRGSDGSMSILMIDIDRFRDCNEQHSASFGDKVLRRLASIMRRICNESDFLARDHADRFVVAVRGAHISGIRSLAGRLRQAVRSESFGEDGVSHEASVCIGIAHSSGGFIETEHQLIDRARLAVEFAKKLGEDRICAWDDVLNGPAGRVAGRDGASPDRSSWIQGFRQHLRSSYLETTRALVAAIEARDPYTKNHSVTVSHYAEIIAKRMKLDGRACRTIRAAALLHDVGKIGIPDAILTKAGALTDEEFDIVKRHPQTGLDILEHVSFLSEERPLILHHHERFDGGGYPAGLKGDRIPVGARVLAVADAIDAMLSPRTYKPAYSTERVRQELRSGMGCQFDPVVAEVAVNWLENKPAQGGKPLYPTQLRAASASASGLVQNQASTCRLSDTGGLGATGGLPASAAPSTNTGRRAARGTQKTGCDETLAPKP